MARRSRGMNFFDWLAIILLMVSGLVHGVLGVFKKDLVELLWVNQAWNLPVLQQITYMLVGLAFVYTIVRGIYLLVAR